MDLEIESQNILKRLLNYVEIEHLKDFLLEWNHLRQTVGAFHSDDSFYKTFACHEVLDKRQQQKTLLDLYNDVLCCCIMRQTNQEELEAFNQAIKSLSQHSCFNSSLATIESLYDTRNDALTSLRTNGAEDTCRPVIIKFSWTLHHGMSILLRTTKQQFAADPVSLSWILKANHFSVNVQDVCGDGNCMLYATQAALGSVGIVADVHLFSKALRWLLFEKAVHVDKQTSEIEALKQNKTFTDGDLCMPIMCVFFGINMRILSAHYTPSTTSWNLLCHRYTLRSQLWNEWVRKTSLAGKIPFLEWDPVTDADAIRNFQEMGGARAFVCYSVVTFDGSAISVSNATEDNTYLDNFTDTVAILLGHSDPFAETNNQLTIAFTSCGPDGHYCALLPSKIICSPPNVIEDIKRDTLQHMVTLMFNMSSADCATTPSTSPTPSSSSSSSSSLLQSSLEEGCLCSKTNCKGCRTFQDLNATQRNLFRERMVKELCPELIVHLHTFAERNENDLLFTLMKWFNVTPLRLSRLATNKWLDNETINFTMELLANKHQIQKREKSSLIIHALANNVQLDRWSRWNHSFDQTLRGRQVTRYWKLNSLKLDKIYIPFHQNQTHWIVGIVEMGTSKVRIFDSDAGDNTNFELALLKWIERELKMQNEQFVLSSWLVTHEKGPQQNNSYDCGLFVLAAVEMEMIGIGHIYNQSMMSYLRERVGCEILECRLKELEECSIVGDTSPTSKHLFLNVSQECTNFISFSFQSTSTCRK